MKRLILFFLFLTSVCQAQNPLTVFHGGTSRSSLDAHRLLLGAASSPLVSLANGTSGYVLTAQGAGNDPIWSPAPGAITDYIKTDPSVFQNNTIQPTGAGIYPLIIEAFNNSVDIFTVQTSDEQYHLNVTGAGIVQVYNKLELNSASGISQLIFDGNHGSFGQVPISGGASGALTWINPVSAGSGISIAGGLGGTNVISLGVLTNLIPLTGLAKIPDQTVLGNISGGTANVVAVPISSIFSLSSAVILNPLTDARNAIEPAGDIVALQLKATNLITKNLLEIYTNVPSLSTVIDATGNYISDANIVTSAFISAGSIAPGIRLSTYEPVQGTPHFREQNNGSIVDRAFNSITTTNAAPSFLYAWNIAAGTVQMVRGFVKGRQATGGGTGNGCIFEIWCGAQNIGGVVTIIGQTIGGRSSIAGVGFGSVTFVVVGTTVAIRVTGIAANIDWDVYGLEFL